MRGRRQQQPGGDGASAGNRSSAPVGASAQAAGSDGDQQAPKKQQVEQRRRTMSNSFMTLRYKISMCKRADPHNWRLCPYAHEGEAGRRRPPHMYKAVMCEFAKADCPLGDVCTFAHNALEYWLHPDKYRTTLCGQGEACNRNICFFAHSHSELRIPGSEAAAKGASRNKAESSADPAADLLARLSLGAGSSRSAGGQQAMQQAQHPSQLPQQQVAQLGLGMPYRDPAGAGSSGSAFLHLGMPAAADSTQQLWMAQQQQAMPGMLAQHSGADPAVIAAALTAVAAGGSGALDQYQLRPEFAAQAALQAPLMGMPGALPGVQAHPPAAAAGGARPAAPDTQMRLAARQQQASMVPGASASHGWVPGLAAVPAGAAGPVDPMQQPVYPMSGVQGPQPVWSPQAAQVYGFIPWAAFGSPSAAYAAGWPIAALQQLQPTVLAQRAQQLLPVLQPAHPGTAALPAMQGLVEEPATGEVPGDVHRSTEHAGYSER